MLGCHIVRTAEHELNIAVADDLGPEVIGVAVLQLTETLNGQHDPDVPGTHHAEGAGKVRSIRSAADLADVVELIQDQIDRHVAAAVGLRVRVTGQLDEHEGEKQGRQESHACLLVAEHHKVGAFLPGGVRQVNVRLTCDPLYGLVL